MDLPAGFATTERGNILLESDGNWLDNQDCRSKALGYYSCGEDIWLEVSITPDNYPVSNVVTFKQTDEDLANHIRIRCEGWLALKMNLNGVEVNSDGIVTGKLIFRRLK